MVSCFVNCWLSCCSVNTIRTKNKTTQMYTQNNHKHITLNYMFYLSTQTAICAEQKKMYSDWAQIWLGLHLDCAHNLSHTWTSWTVLELITDWLGLYLDWSRNFICAQQQWTGLILDSDCTWTEHRLDIKQTHHFVSQNLVITKLLPLAELFPFVIASSHPQTPIPGTTPLDAVNGTLDVDSVWSIDLLHVDI